MEEGGIIIMTIYNLVSSKEYTTNHQEKGSDFMARKSRIRLRAVWSYKLIKLTTYEFGC